MAPAGAVPSLTLSCVVMRPAVEPSRGTPRLIACLYVSASNSVPNACNAAGMSPDGTAATR